MPPRNRQATVRGTGTHKTLSDRVTLRSQRFSTRFSNRNPALHSMTRATASTMSTVLCECPLSAHITISPPIRSRSRSHRTSLACQRHSCVAKRDAAATRTHARTGRTALTRTQRTRFCSFTRASGTLYPPFSEYNTMLRIRVSRVIILRPLMRTHIHTRTPPYTRAL